VNPDLRYNRFLRDLGYAGENPWHDHANSALGEDGSVLSGWSLRHAGLPARVAEPHSETAYMTDRALQFIRETGDRPWVLHLSYIKPHWPLMAPAPYHALYGADDVPAPVRSEAERERAHPVIRAFMNIECSQTYSDDAKRAVAVPTYMGLIKQLDDHLGRLLHELEQSGRLDDTAIIFTSDHGDYLGDHWLGEKELFHDASARIPMIISDPDPAADATRGTVDSRLVEAIDIVPTILDWMGIEDPGQRIEGRSLAAGLRGEIGNWRDCAFSEIDYAFYRSRLTLGVSPSAARAWMVRNERWKYVHYKGFAPQLFDLQEDPDELVDLGDASGLAPVRAEMQAMLLDRLTDRRNRVAMSDQVVADRTDGSTRAGVIIGKW
jgi:arylsulfatase A-like enzyme